jgi:hypothetical protein
LGFPAMYDLIHPNQYLKHSPYSEFISPGKLFSFFTLNLRHFKILDNIADEVNH